MIIEAIKNYLGYVKHNFYDSRPSKLGFCGKDVYIGYPISIHNPMNFFIEDKASIKSNSIIINTTGKVIIKKYATVAQGATIITGNHHIVKGKSLYTSISKRLADIEKDIIIEEDSWLGTNVTLLSGVTIGRGCIVGAGSVVRNSTPPYSVVIGNPAKVIRFVFSSLEDIIEHEKALYPEEERISIDILKDYYNKFQINLVHE